MRKLRKLFATEPVRTIGQTTMYLHTWGTKGWARKVFTPWGVRTVEITGDADTFFSQPARLTLSHNGKRYNVPGFVTVRTADGLDSGEALGLEFHGDTSYVQVLPKELQRGVPDVPATPPAPAAAPTLVPEAEQEPLVVWEARFYLDTDGSVLAILPNHKLANGRLVSVQWTESYPKDEYKVWSVEPSTLEDMQALTRDEVADLEPALLDYLRYRGEDI